MPLAKLRLRLWWASHKQCVHSFNNEYFWITDTNNDYRKINCKNAVWWNFSELGSLAGLFTIRKDVPYNSCLRLYVNTWCGSNWLIQGPYFMWELSVVISRRYTPPLSVCGRVSMYDIQATASNMSQNKGRTILFRTPRRREKVLAKETQIFAREAKRMTACVCVYLLPGLSSALIKHDHVRSSCHVPFSSTERYTKLRRSVAGRSAILRQFSKPFCNTKTAA